MQFTKSIMENKTTVAEYTGLRNPLNQALTQQVVSAIPAAYSQAGPLPALAPLQTAPTDVSPVSAVASAPVIGVSADLSNAITFTATNNTGSAALYRMFDAWGLLSSVLNTTATQMLYIDSNRTTAFNAESAVRPFAFSGFSIQASVSAASLANPVTFYQISSTGPSKTMPLYPSAAQRNTQYNANLLTFEFARAFTAGPDCAVTFRIPDGETITFTWFLVGQSNRLF